MFERKISVCLAWCLFRSLQLHNAFYKQCLLVFHCAAISFLLNSACVMRTDCDPEDGSTPLHHAPAFGQSQVPETLVKVGCQPRNGAAGALSMVHWVVVSLDSWNMFGRGAHKHPNAVWLFVWSMEWCGGFFVFLCCVCNNCQAPLAPVAVGLQSGLVFFKSLALE